MLLKTTVISKIFRENNSSTKNSISRKFCDNIGAVKVCNFHTVWGMSRKKIPKIRDLINHLKGIVDYPRVKEIMQQFTYQEYFQASPHR